MTDALTSLDMSAGLRKVAERAKREPAARFHSLAHLIDEELLAGVYQRLRGGGVGRGGRHHEGAIRTGLAEQSAGPARTAANEAISSSGDPTGAHSQGEEGSDAANRHLNHGRQGGSECAACGVGGSIRTGLPGLLVRPSTRT